MKKIKSSALALIIVFIFGTIVYAADNKTNLVDINTATETQLKALPGVGEESAKRIIAGRPYYQKGELKAKKVITTDQFEKINKLIQALC